MSGTLILVVALVIMFAIILLPRPIDFSARRTVITKALEGGPMAGCDLQQILAAKGVGLSPVCFYRMMSLWEDEPNGVIGYWQYDTLAGQPIKERWYRLPPVLAPESEAPNDG